MCWLGKNRQKNHQNQKTKVSLKYANRVFISNTPKAIPFSTGWQQYCIPFWNILPVHSTTVEITRSLEDGRLGKIVSVETRIDSR